MKGNIKRLVVFVTVPTIAMLMAVATASAGPPLPPPPVPQAIHAQYDFTGGGTCLYAPFGFNSTFTPINAAGGAWIIQTFSRWGTYTFNRDGTGSVMGHGRAITFQYASGPSPAPPVPPSAATQEQSWDFTYQVTDDGTITITEVPGTFVSQWTSGPWAPGSSHVEGQSFEGTITPDGKTITLNSGVPDQLTITPGFIPGLPLKIICNNSLVLTWRY